MASMNFPKYSRLEGLNSLVTKCVHTLCVPTNDAATLSKAASTLSASSLSISSLYDINLLTNSKKRVNSKVPCRLLELYLDRFHSDESKQNKSLLDIQSRQSVLDYIIREKILVSANFVLRLLQDGGVGHFDLWQLCEINEFTSTEVERILQRMSSCAGAFRSLSIGGTAWIYDFTLERGPLRKLLSQASLRGLKSLKMQQVSFESFFALMHSCSGLQRLEIAQPSLQCSDIERLASYLLAQSSSSTSGLPAICNSLRLLSLPSSVNDRGLMHLLPLFPALTTLRCTPFEELLDTLEQTASLGHHLHLPTAVSAAHRSVAVLANLRSLTIAHPMSADTVDRLLLACPRLVELSLQVQEGMSLGRLATHAPFLRRLALNNSPSMPLNFVEHVAPLLKTSGAQLMSLSLEYFDHIDLATVARCCPQLRSLSAQWFSTVTLGYEQHLSTQLQRLLNYRNCQGQLALPFAELRHLRLRPRPHQSLSAQVVAYLLTGATHLRHIELYCCEELTDEAILEISERNPLECLQTFILRHGHQVTREALCQLVSVASSSAEAPLVFHDCGLVPPLRKEDM